MKKTTLIIMTLTLLIVSVACANVKGDVTTTENSTTTTVSMTGYPSGVQMPMLYLNGKLYVFGGYCNIGNADAVAYVKEHGLAFIGETKAEQNEKEPSKEYVGARLPAGTKIYSDKDGEIYVLEGERILTLKVQEDQ